MGIEIDIKDYVKSLIDKAGAIEVRYEYPKHYHAQFDEKGGMLVWPKPIARDVIIRFTESLK